MWGGKCSPCCPALLRVRVSEKKKKVRLERTVIASVLSLLSLAHTLALSTWDMLGKRKERMTDPPTSNLKNEGDDTAPQSGYTVARQLVLEELDLEIHMRERLKETIESRIGWATCLQTSLNAVRETPGASVYNNKEI